MEKQDFLHFLGFHIADPKLEVLVNGLAQFAFVFIIGWIAFFVGKRWLSVLILKIVGKTKTTWDDMLYEERFFSKLAYLIPPISAYVALSFLDWLHTDVIKRFIDVWIIIASLFILTSLLNAINRIYESYPIARNRPIKVFIQVFKIFVYCCVVVSVISVMFGESPKELIVGLGAFAAVLMLIFKDSILGFVAGIQLIANNMVRIGDWIVMPNNNADGEVLEINLYTVKVQNWDKTISTIPTYKLVSESFTNWRGMQESNGRRIKRYVSVDISSVHFLSHEEIEVLKASDFLKNYINEVLPRLTMYNESKETVLDEQKLTNLGVFRNYLEAWLVANPDINKEMTHMVRQLQPTATGIPIEIYCFSAKQEWVHYERVQSDIFDHVLAVIPHFHLRIFQYPTNIFEEAV